MPRKFNPKVADIAREKIGQFVRSRRTELGWSQQKVSDIADLRQATVNDVEQGRSYNVNTLIAILGAMRCELQLVPHDINSIPGIKTPSKN